MSVQRPRYTLHQLEVLVAISESGSITAAAERLHMSASAVSASIRELERLLGQELVVRRPSKGARITVDGANVLQRAREILQRATELQATLSPHGQISGPLRLGCFPSLAPTVEPELASTFLAEHPAVQLHFREGDQLQFADWLREGAIDLAITYDIDCPPDWHVTPFDSREMMLVVSRGHTLAGRTEPVEVAEVAAEPMVLFDLAPSTAHVMAVCRRAGFTPTIAYRTGSYETVRSHVARGHGWTLLLQRPVGDMSYEGMPLAYKRIAQPPLPLVSVGLAFSPQATLSRAARAFRTHARAAAANPG